MINYDFLFALDLVERKKKTKVTDMGCKKNMEFFSGPLEDGIVWGSNKTRTWMELNMKICSS